MGAIDKRRIINPAVLKGDAYFQSLIEQGYSTGLLNSDELDHIQLECFKLLTEITKHYLNGESSSVPVEVAQSLLESLLFTLGIWLKTFSNPDDAIVEIRESGIPQIYQWGRKRIDQQMKKARKLHREIVIELMETENVFYRSTIVDGIQGFFKLYYPEYTAHEIHITADYPVHHSIEPLNGIEFILRYLECIHSENQFCILFSAPSIQCLLRGYHPTYDQLLFNIYELVLSTAIGCVIVGKNPLELALTPKDVEKLRGIFQNRKKEALQDLLSQAVTNLSTQFSLNPATEQYLCSSLPKIVTEIECCMLTQRMNRLFVVPENPKAPIQVRFTFGEKMSDENYRRVLNEFMGCRYGSDRVALIQNEIKTLGDLEDILLDGELNQEEIVEILKLLSPTGVAALVKKYGMTDEPVYDSGMFRECEITLIESLRSFINSLPLGDKDWIEQSAEILEVENQSTKDGSFMDS